MLSCEICFLRVVRLTRLARKPSGSWRNLPAKAKLSASHARPPLKSQNLTPLHAPPRKNSSSLFPTMNCAAKSIFFASSSRGPLSWPLSRNSSKIPGPCRTYRNLGKLARSIFFPVAGVLIYLSMRTLEQTTQEVLDLAAKHFQMPAGSLAPGDDFFKKLGIDSLQTLEMLSRLENHFGIELPDYEVQGVSDFKTLAERIQSRL